MTISAAASLTDALNQLQKRFEAAHPGVRLQLNYGASGTLQRQIEQGAPVDVFLSASTEAMKRLADGRFVGADSTSVLLGNELVVVTPADGGLPIRTMEDLAKTEVKRVAIGIPESVPAGEYAKEALVATRLWDGLQAKTVQAKDVRQVLQTVETGNADAGFVYRTDAAASRKVKIALAVDPNTYSPIEYPAAVVSATKHPAEAETFYAFLRSEEALAVFREYGFTSPAGS
ncbi:putative ABC transporter substrate-binding lipoprotein YvgL [Paenibacillus sp. J31TS4]|nr:molybdate ABC transporter substrate-binding protein [Paenibacillus sp. J31TS4]GIP37027.1 putative ABC transporter substrate-binding lipoprotein YvgL [Paenibacillus sp. J31TS4]